jgi:hypothetical protein
MVVASPVPDKKSLFFNSLYKKPAGPGGLGRQDSAFWSAENAGNRDRQAGPPASGVNFNATPFMQ